ncbi:MAG: cytochrome c oxidase assembly protein [Gemmatimonadota bacterium]
MNHAHDAVAGWLPQLVPGLGLAILASLHLVGTLRSPRGGKRRRRAIMFEVGIALVAIAVLSPIHRLGEQHFAWHMVQHQLLLVLATPFLILGRPVPALISGLPRSWRSAARRAASSSVMRFVRGPGPFVASVLHALVVWIWHAPPFVNASVTNAGWHGVQHASFLVVGVLFWASIERARIRHIAAGAGVVSLLATALHTGALGALLVFSTRPLYGEYVGRARDVAGALEDQQLAGVLMWVPGGLVYMAAALVLLAAVARTRAPARVPPNSRLP